MAASTKQRHPAALAYASAMLQVGSSLGEASAFGEQLIAVANAISNDPQMRVFIESPKISRENKKAVFSSALTGKVAEQVLNLLQLLIDRGRQFLVQDIADTYSELEDAAAGRVKATITSAVELPAEQRESLVASIQTKTGREVVATQAVDPELLAGLTIQVGDLVVDGSLRSHLHRVRQEVLQTRFGKDLIDEN
ncbi:MAG: ATP synthase F1 subunit delta [Planctomycetia bacterium]|jgi:F-type H+-transporting ATPase subunit delta|nr:ATP synthase F1 subunit delta [Planctomycetota bacterium]NCF55464.1 ATP synthase F1 subunit delta [Planctomycetia bacterium]NCG57125.1 ATP synthase F1 subunit delta [Pseudomonadota bacterium]MDC3251609.1 ATP synthase F1 subunit delta [Planctomycetota bacterium]NCF99554.1 ATP synthase F1 subunit delta [Planctomycetia bacterium]